PKVSNSRDSSTHAKGPSAQRLAAPGEARMRRIQVIRAGAASSEAERPVAGSAQLPACERNTAVGRPVDLCCCGMWENWFAGEDWTTKGFGGLAKPRATSRVG